MAPAIPHAAGPRAPLPPTVREEPSDSPTDLGAPASFSASVGEQSEQQDATQAMRTPPLFSVPQQQQQSGSRASLASAALPPVYNGGPLPSPPLGPASSGSEGAARSKARRVDLRLMSSRLNVPYSELLDSLYSARTDIAVVPSDVLLTRGAAHARSLMAGDRHEPRSAAVAIAGGGASRYRWAADGRVVAHSLPTRGQQLASGPQRAASPPAQRAFFASSGDFSARGSGRAPARNYRSPPPAPPQGPGGGDEAPHTGSGAEWVSPALAAGLAGWPVHSAGGLLGSKSSLRSAQHSASSGSGSERSPLTGNRGPREWPSWGEDLASGRDDSLSWLPGPRAHKVIRMSACTSPVSGAGRTQGAADDTGMPPDSPVVVRGGSALADDVSRATLQGVSPPDTQLLVRRRSTAPPREDPSEMAALVIPGSAMLGGVLGLPSQRVPSRSGSPQGRLQSGSREGAAFANAFGGGAATENELVVDPPTKRHVRWLHDKGGPPPIESICVYEQGEDVLVMDVRYARPALAWGLLGFATVAAGYAAWQAEEMEARSGLSNDAAAEVLAWWTTLGEAVLFGVVFPCAWLPSREEVRLVREWRPRLLVVALAALLCAERMLTAWSLRFSEAAHAVPPQLAISQYALVLITGRAIACQRVIWIEVAAEAAILVGASLILASAYQDGRSDGSSSSPGHEFASLLFGLVSSALSAAELLLMRRLRAMGMTLMLMVTLPRMLASVGHLAAACLWAESMHDVFSEVKDYDRWRYMTVVLASCATSVGVVHSIAYLHPVTVALMLSAQAVFVVPFMVDSDKLLSAGYGIGIVLLLLGAAWGSYISARIRRDVSVELSVGGD
eukprot:TRINITY_DN6465_c0_g1_i1.p1 TRINITY_DN6465_c0_g1~~TRINITY_DN6465_c0_g1_i1.p1  ORF type:complete len:877 (+),score=151.79 TRINITY_DN6465_c0_g1_i1:100-2631(+)